MIILQTCFDSVLISILLQKRFNLPQFVIDHGIYRGIYFKQINHFMSNTNLSIVDSSISFHPCPDNDEVKERRRVPVSFSTILMRRI